MNDESRRQHQPDPDSFGAPRLSHSRRSGNDSRALVPLGKSGDLARLDAFGGTEGNRGGIPKGKGPQFSQWAKIDHTSTPDGGVQVKGERFRGFQDHASGTRGFSHETGDLHSGPDGFSKQVDRSQGFQDHASGTSRFSHESSKLHSGPDGFSKRVERFQAFQDTFGNSSSSSELSEMHHGPGGSSGFRLTTTQSTQGDRKLSAMHFSTEGMGRSNLKFSVFQQSHGDRAHSGGQGQGRGKNGLGFQLDLGGGRGVKLSLGVGGDQGGGRSGSSLSMHQGGKGGSKLGLAMGLAKFGVSLAQHGSGGQSQGGGGTNMSLSLGHGGLNLSLSKGGSGGMKMSMSLGGGGGGKK
ncbi:MAG: hypothetical protein COX57_02795 [Alphaproteobacteria bacterium CG_4_10_14_0_2_um_filter_63_37]|nr:MAG: hypothetical protein AUJ55_03265 [Proteobacteria bacterium CG1_02_64_396]PJA25472.1 MAG: hypothetical protein COX57_02795 [Alphaproteobacteria bacterium CG_4_10_14_0_2_um_filter_63_37]